MTVSQAIDKAEPIPGYQVKERIGAGGYGEVWSAEAPGELVKAIKFVYGYLDEDRASRELKALNRVKSVRHPFLLSLERIEIVDGQLLIVTELADGSLKDRFEECGRAGLEGVPREELLGYVRDAAEALDYMSENYSLQHLDVKPENLLLLAGRIKVADFGLVKDIQDHTVSLMGGMTPLYAPPEVFDGRPSRRSDQYSLAIVYQEMLTGALPFPGKTAAQLAVQHLNAKPQLSSLPECDQQAIAIALNKDPEQRFKTCVALVDALTGKSPAPAAAAPEPVSAGATQPIPGNDGGFFCGPDSQPDDRESPAQQRVSKDAHLLATRAPLPPPIRATEKLETLPPIEIAPDALQPRPTLFVAIGGLAAQALRRFRRQVYDRFGPLDRLPSLQMLLLDTDAKALSEINYGDDETTFAPQETISLPLRRTQDYRGESRKHLQWLSRRWIYNIPRSLQTEGLRPLGRLALIDHAPQVFDRMEKALGKAVDEQSRQATTEATGLSFCNDEARVVVIAAISGGTGGGMVLDTAYAARKLLADHGYSDRNVDGVLLHGCGRNPTAKELATVNAYACLRELHHYSRPGGCYPGDAVSGLPAYHENNAAFDNTYFSHLGEDLTDEDFAAAAEQVARYLFLDTATSAGAFFNECRKRESPCPSDQPDVKLRSFALTQLSCAQDSLVSTASQKLCRQLVSCWMDGEMGPEAEGANKSPNRSPSAIALERRVNEKITAHGIDEKDLIGQLQQLAVAEMKGQPDDYFNQLISDALHGSKSAPSLPPEEAAAAAIDRALGWRKIEGDGRQSGKRSIASVLEVLASKMGAEKGALLRDWILGLVDEPAVRVAGARRACEALAQRSESIVSRLEQLAVQARQEVEAVRQTMGVGGADAGDPSRRVRKRPKTVAAPNLKETLSRYAQLRLNEFMVGSAARMAQTVGNHVASASTQLLELRRDLNHFATEFESPEPQVIPQATSTRPEDQFLSAVEERLRGGSETLAHQLDERLQKELLVPLSGLRCAVSLGGDQRAKLVAALRVAARNHVVRALHDIDVTELVLPLDEDESKSAARLKDILDAGQPRVLGCGGGKRLLLMLPNGSTDSRIIRLLHESFHETPSVAVNCDGDLVLCYEVEQVSAAQAAAILIEGRPDFAEFASRLQTRNDVEWSPLPEIV